MMASGLLEKKPEEGQFRERGQKEKKNDVLQSQKAVWHE